MLAYGSSCVLFTIKALQDSGKQLYLWEISNFYHKMQKKDGKYMFGVVKVGDKGQIVIPKDARKLYDIKPGDTLMLLGDQKGLAMLKTDIFQAIIDQAMEGLTK